MALSPQPVHQRPIALLVRGDHVLNEIKAGKLAEAGGQTVEVVRRAVLQAGADAAIEKVEDLREILKYRVMRTPAVAIDGRVVHTYQPKLTPVGP